MRHKTNCSTFHDLCSMIHVPWSMNRGVSLLFAVLILSVVLSIGLGLSVLLIQQIKTISETGHSVIAFFAADNGIEEVLTMATTTSIAETALPNGAKYEVIVTTPGPDCAAPNFCIKSIGSYGQTKRAIEIQY
jgi:uncharacterized protein (UPF0333 family)